jgi:hypothetical protein
MRFVKTTGSNVAIAPLECLQQRTILSDGCQILTISKLEKNYRAIFADVQVTLASWQQSGKF